MAQRSTLSRASIEQTHHVTSFSKREFMNDSVNQEEEATHEFIPVVWRSLGAFWYGTTVRLEILCEDRNGTKHPLYSVTNWDGTLRIGASITVGIR